MEYRYEHFGIPTKLKRKDMLYFPEYKVWCSDYEKDPFRIEWIYFEKECTLHPLIQTAAHICFLVDDIERAVSLKSILLKPIFYDGYRMAFIEEDGVPIEFIQLS